MNAARIPPENALATIVSRIPRQDALRIGVLPIPLGSAIPIDALQTVQGNAGQMNARPTVRGIAGRISASRIRLADVILTGVRPTAPAIVRKTRAHPIHQVRAAPMFVPPIPQGNAGETAVLRILRETAK